MAMVNRLFSADEIYTMTMHTLVPLKCQERYARQLASLLSMHLKRSALMECGFPAESLPSCSAIVVSETGQGKSFILRQMAKAVGVNLIVVDASTLAKETWKGATLGERLLAEKESAKDLSVFRKSVLFSMRSIRPDCKKTQAILVIRWIIYCSFLNPEQL